MLTDPEVRRWASLMLTSALRGNMPKESVLRQMCILRAHHGTSVFENVLEQMLLEAGRVGPLHCNGKLYNYTKAELPDSVK